MFTDDLTGNVCTETEVQTVTFAVGRHTDEIDLSENNASSLRNDVAACIEHARTVTKPKTTGPKTTGPKTTRRPECPRVRRSGAC